MDTMILAIIAAVVAVLLIGPCVAVGAVIDARNIRSLAALLRSRLEAVSDELGGALWHLQDGKRRIGLLKAEVASLKTRLEGAKRREEMRRQAQVRAAKWITFYVEERKKLLNEKEALLASVRGLTADAEGASREAAELSAFISALMRERAQTNKRLSAANNRVKALEAFINKAYGPVDECEIGSRVCGWCETQDLAGGNTCEVCDQPF